MADAIRRIIGTSDRLGDGGEELEGSMESPALSLLAAGNRRHRGPCQGARESQHEDSITPTATPPSDLVGMV
jgi:hypothetical protein